VRSKVQAQTLFAWIAGTALSGVVMRLRCATWSVQNGELCAPVTEQWGQD
jgi:hypothetical protein